MQIFLEQRSYIGNIAPFFIHSRKNSAQIQASSYATCEAIYGPPSTITSLRPLLKPTARIFPVSASGAGRIRGKGVVLQTRHGRGIFGNHPPYLLGRESETEQAADENTHLMDRNRIDPLAGIGGYNALAGATGAAIRARISYTIRIWKYMSFLWRNARLSEERRRRRGKT